MIFQDLAQLTLAERSDYIVAAATELGLSELVIEKDFWVVWLLQHLFALSPTLGPFTFKGGTSLSKGFNAIQRFSEDIDVSISRARLGFSNEAYFYEAPSAKETKRRVDQIREKVRVYVIEAVLPALRAKIDGNLRGEWELLAGEPGSLQFRYPTAQRGSLGYIRSDVLLEFGHADSWPARDISISPYVASALAAVTGFVNVHVLDPARTFWEKATILHEIANRDESLPFPDRYSRHYYDVVRLANSPTGEAAINNIDLLHAVARFKSVFFASNRARYDLAKPGTLRLRPPAFRHNAVAADYEQMLPMLFGDVPSFDDLMRQVDSLEVQINGDAPPPGP
jgi:hypothetical protein